MDLELPYYDDKVVRLNPNGNVGVLTLWSKIDVVMKRLGTPPPEFAAIANLYGDGISQLLANLLNNPQINCLILIGNNRTDSATELRHYFQHGTETVKINGTIQYRIVGTNRLVNEAVADAAMFMHRPVKIIEFHRDVNGVARSLDDQIADMLAFWGTSPVPPREHELFRASVKLIDAVTTTFPSIKQGHQVISSSLLDAWGETLFLIERFGSITALKKGDRKELLNLKVVVTSPKWHDDVEYAKYNLSSGRLRAYCDAMLSPYLDSDTSYTYGHRLKEYFGRNMVDHVVSRLAGDREDRKSYLSLWDTFLDVFDSNEDGTPRGHPCWVGCFFRVSEGLLTLSATFRTHRAYTAWIENAHGLMTLQSQVAIALGVEVGPLTVMSHSISIDPGQLALVESITKARKWKLRDDGRGEVVFSLNGGKALVEHRSGGLVLKRYESANIEALSHQLAQDGLVSDLNHAFYVGRQLGKLQLCLKHGLPYEEA